MRRWLVIVPALTVGVLFAVPVGPGLAKTAGSHAAITITSNADFTSCACVTSGDGTAAHPFVIGPWSINAPSGKTRGWSVKVDNSTRAITDYFNIFGISSTYNDTSPTDPAIWLVDVKTPTLISGNSADPTSGNDLGMGIELDHSANISIDNVAYNKGNGTGVYINGSSNVSINNAKFKATCSLCSPHVGDGIYAVNSTNVQVGTGSDCPTSASAPCVDVTYDDGMGVWFRNSSNSVIDHASASANDTGGYVLDGPGSYNDTVENSTSSGTGNICFTYNGRKVNSGYYTDLQGGMHLINGAHNNTINGNTFHSQTGLDISSGGNIINSVDSFYDACQTAYVPYTQAPTPVMGSGNTFSNNCYRTTDIASLPTPVCAKSLPAPDGWAATSSAHPRGLNPAGGHFQMPELDQFSGAVDRCVSRRHRCATPRRRFPRRAQP